MLTLKPIGIIESCYKQKFGTPRQPGLVPESYAIVNVKKEFQPEFSLLGLEGFSHIWLVWGFHQNSNLGFRAKVHPPRLNGKALGLFATRSPHRPNPIGLSLVTLEKIEWPNRIHVKGIDLIDETPIYDIKPYLPVIESPSTAKTGWLPEEPENPRTIKITWSTLAMRQLEQWNLIEANRALRQIVEDSIRLDPRPLVYKKRDNDDQLLRDSHAMRVGLADIRFRYLNDFEIEIREVIL